MSDPQMPEHLRTRGPGERPKVGQCLIRGIDVRDVTDASLERLLRMSWGPLMTDLIEGEARHRGMIE